MKKSPRFLFWIIILFTLISVVINLPKIENIPIPPTKKTFNLDSNAMLRSIGVKKELKFRKGLDLEGGTRITYKADLKTIAQAQKSAALNSARVVIERRVNLFGVSEPIVQTAVTNSDSRIIVELPGVDINQAKSIIGTTAELTFWEEVGTTSGKFKSNQPNYPPNLPPGFNKTNLSGNDLKQSSVGFNQNNGKPQVLLTFTSSGTQKFAEITKRTTGKRLAMVLDDIAIEAPMVNEPILGGNAEISGGFTVETANALSTELNAGALPVPLISLSEEMISPTLGMSSLQKSLFAGAIGLFIIIVFMLVLYGKLGFIASLALLLYTLFNLAIFKVSSITPYGITLTLSGIAGFILSIGMAVDANILIFERTKEERRLGKSYVSAIEIGFSRAWSSIRDSNVSTLITCLVLYNFGTGMVRGFALVLAIGVLTSMFSAIVVTRTFLRMVHK
jgi:preprotein translocase subunit SecD